MPDSNSYRLKEVSYMKKILAFLLVSVLIFGICGCAKSGKEEAAANDLFTDEFSVMWSVYAASPALQKAASI